MIFRRPNNFKNAKYVGGIFDVKDLVIMIVSVLGLVVFLLTYISLTDKVNIVVIISIFFSIAIICTMNVTFPVFHNLRTYFWSLIQYSNRLKLFTWEGRYRYEENEEDNN